VLAVCCAATLLAVVLVLRPGVLRRRPAAHATPATPTPTPTPAVIKHESTRHADAADGFVLDHREGGREGGWGGGREGDGGDAGDGGAAPA
jgi:hypothetical protein